MGRLTEREYAGEMQATFHALVREHFAPSVRGAHSKAKARVARMPSKALMCIMHDNVLQTGERYLEGKDIRLTHSTSIILSSPLFICERLKGPLFLARKLTCDVILGMHSNGYF